MDLFEYSISYQQGTERKKDTFKSSILLKLTMSESHLRSLKSPGLCSHKTVKQTIETIDFELESFLEAEEKKFTLSKWPYGPLQIEWTNLAQLLNKHFKYIDLLAKTECRYSSLF